MEASEKLDVVQKKLRVVAKQEHRIEKSGQQEMFAANTISGYDRDHTDLSEVKEYLLTRLSSIPRYFGVEEFADMLEETGWFIGDLQKALGELVTDCKARNLDDDKGRRRSQFVHYKGNSGRGERLVNIKA
ncbi:MAG: hypothetical protein M0024_06525 [Nitrospiraceae bacterium]|nr:hypothetical protein [Nitrospiraceae bacterium]